MGKPAILDLDDAPSRTKSAVTLRNAEAMLATCSAVTVGSEELRNYARRFNANCYLIPSCIKLEHYAPLEDRSPERGPAESPAVTLGWIGNGAHYSRDLIEVLVDPLRAVASRTPLRLRIVGACSVPELRKAFTEIPNLTVELVDQIDWGQPGATRAALAGVDIGLYPLLDNDFNRYKCGFKALEYMALGLPVVASPVSAIVGIVRPGVDGSLCSTPAEWERALEKLATDPGLRRRMGLAGRTRVESEFSTRSAAQILAGILTRESSGGTL